MDNQASVMIIYTGGTIGMVSEPDTGLLKPFEFEHIYRHLPELKAFDIKLQVHAFDDPIDSSDMHPDIWCYLAELIHEKYEQYDGFVILHGSDTMAYTASALSFMLQNLNKPIILTGSQLPVGLIRTDGKENLITAIEIAAAKDELSQPIINEVAIYFEYQLTRGNRTTKISASNFDAFASMNFPKLAEAGVDIKYNHDDLLPHYQGNDLRVQLTLNNRVSLVKLYPGMRPELLQSLTHHKNIKGIVLETYGSGNAPTASWFTKMVSDWIEQGKIIVVITQCKKGEVMLGKYANSKVFQKKEIINGVDMTAEAAVTKLMYSLSIGNNHSEVHEIMNKNISGEMKR